MITASVTAPLETTRACTVLQLVPRRDFWPKNFFGNGPPALLEIFSVVVDAEDVEQQLLVVAAAQQPVQPLPPHDP